MKINDSQAIFVLVDDNLYWLISVFALLFSPVKASPKKGSAGKKVAPVSAKKLGGTVKPAQPFNPMMDSERLYDALDGFGTDERAIIEILPYRTNGQRQEIKAKYQDKFSKVGDYVHVSR